MEEQVSTTNQNPSRMVLLAVIVVLVLAGGGYYFMRSQGQQATNDDAMMEESKTAEDSAMQEDKLMAEESSIAATSEMVEDTQMMDDEVQIVEVEAGSFYYKPNEIRVKKGQKVTVVMNSVSMMHDFVIDELGVKMPVVQNGDTGEVTFEADQVGEFEYYCSVGQHRAQGQVGTLIVEE